jgi:poly(3-hydroxybutyrate) depolymerase
MVSVTAGIHLPLFPPCPQQEMRHFCARMAQALLGFDQSRGAAPQMYHAYQAYAGLSDQIRRTAASSERVMSLWSAMQFAAPLRCIQAYHELVALGGFTHHRPDFGITEVKTDSGEIAPVVQGAVSETPFCTLLRFARAGAIDAPRVLLVAPMSGHFATLLRGTIQTLVRDHEVYVTDWRNPRDIPIDQGA